MSEDSPDQRDVERIAARLAADVDPSTSAVAVHRLAGGHSSGAWRVDATTARGARAMVLKLEQEPSVVLRRHACREAGIMAALHRLGAPVPEILAMERGTAAGSPPAFLMERVEGRSVADRSPGGYHDDEELRVASEEERRAVWESFYDALAALHSADHTAVADARLGDGSLRDVLAYWREALLDAAPAPTVPRQLNALDWLENHIPPGGEEAPAVCLGDARLVNGIVAGDRVQALVDFEVAYVGNPAADIGYGLLLDELHRTNAPAPLSLPSAQETWTRWSRATGRPVTDPEYWTAFGATVLCVTGTRAMIQWGVADGSVESSNPIVATFESLIERAAS